ncbi:hypothetical protein LIPSTDRAFT_67403 [Lipomyces starkeyi NRRL Y-11557]|uniref:Uncharacterized protein n=1 Tax=Lipomyces starkeyi NRRL Y-11557 TaxID=675824 RepID=A0A1E3QFJ9_LIPST|nr:hypothetical protein LIPSTDRAFT_67403 [Lipomyces starkeyi NRRL Y-11557]
MHGPRRWESWNRSAENKRASRLASHEGVDVAKFWGPNPDCVPCELVYLPLRPPGKPSALDGICMRIKGNKQAKKEDVVVAYGAGQFGSTMNGKKLLRLRSCASVFGGMLLWCQSTSVERVESAPNRTRSRERGRILGRKRTRMGDQVQQQKRG